MNEPNPKEVFKMFLKTAMESEQQGSGSHIADDEDLLYEWSLGQLNEDQLHDIRTHLAQCRDCRSEVAEMIRAEALILPPVEESVPDQVSNPVRPAPDIQSSPWGWRTVSVLMTAAAAVLLGVLLLQSPAELSTIELAQQKLEQGEAQTALTMMEEYLQAGDDISADQQATAETVLNRAAYDLATRALNESDFERVLEIESRVARLTESTANLQNLKLQAEYGLPGEFALAMNDSLTQYGYDLDGFAGEKSFPTFDEKTERLKTTFEESIQQFPQSLSLQLNYGYLLLRQSNYENARQAFETVRKLEPENEFALTGLGLIAFENENYTDAQKYFQAALDESPQNADYHVNLAMALEQLKEDDKAKTHWQNALQLTQDAELRQRLENHLQERVPGK